MRRVPSRYDIALRDLDDDEKPHVHYSWTILDAVFHLSRPLLPTDLRFPRATTTEKLKEAPCLTEGLYIWEMDWPSETRGSHAVVGVATKGGLMYPVKRKADSEDPAHRSWGWDLVTTKLMVDGFVHDGSDNKCYPLQQGSSLYVVPDKFHVVLDMSNGTLSFIVDGKWLGTALSGITGHCLYPIVTSRQGNCRIWRYLRSKALMRKADGKCDRTKQSYEYTVCLTMTNTVYPTLWERRW
ncbi:SPRY domain-containing SOCS box protein 4 [Homalodisca vitripennis]|nr:SPRY domain-containing SOCS box protein 4 [Homalodisca vitripennis]